MNTWEGPPQDEHASVCPSLDRLAKTTYNNVKTKKNDAQLWDLRRIDVGINSKQEEDVE